MQSKAFHFDFPLNTETVCLKSSTGKRITHVGDLSITGRYYSANEVDIESVTRNGTDVYDLVLAINPDKLGEIDEAAREHVRDLIHSQIKSVA